VLTPKTWTLAAVCGLAAGCADHHAAQPGSAAPPALLVTTADGTRFEGPPMRLDVSEGAEVPVRATLIAHAPDGRSWSATFGLPLSDLTRGAVSLERRPPAPGIGMVGVDDGRDDPQDFAAGRLTFALGGGHTVQGQTSTRPANGSATFSGQYVLGCWVRPPTIGQAVSGEGDGEVRVADAELTTPFCRALASLR
jgi:hypothetical protein